MLKRFVMFYVLLGFSFSALAQESNYVPLKPELVRAANCLGIVNADTIIKYTAEVYDEDEARDMYFSSFIYSLYVQYENNLRQDFLDGLPQYSQIENDAIRSHINWYLNGMLTDAQNAQADRCLARVMGTIARQLSSTGYKNLDVDEARAAADERFNDFMAILEAFN